MFGSRKQVGTTWVLCIVIGLFITIGCAESNMHSDAVSSFVDTVQVQHSGSTKNGSSKGVSEAAEFENKAGRMLIYSATVAIETSDFEKFSLNLTNQLELLDGFIAKYMDQLSAGDRRTGTWTVRVPSKNFQKLLAWLETNSEVSSINYQSQDVSEEFADLNARLANKKNTETRLTRILEERSGELQEILAIERELDRVREEVERVEGRLRFLSERVTLSTVEIKVYTRILHEAKAVAVSQRIAERWLREAGSQSNDDSPTQ